jgi:hypothetical protein
MHADDDGEDSDIPLHSTSNSAAPSTNTSPVGGQGRSKRRRLPTALAAASEAQQAQMASEIASLSRFPRQSRRPAAVAAAASSVAPAAATVPATTTTQSAWPPAGFAEPVRIAFHF